MELDKAVKYMKLNKSPGHDELTVEFYIAFGTQSYDFFPILSQKYDIKITKFRS